MKPRTCPHCHVVIPDDHGFYFDEQMNLICEACKKIAYSVDEKTDLRLPPQQPILNSE